MGGIHADQVFLRVPCSDVSFDRSLSSQAPFFDNPVLDPQLTRPSRGEDLTPRTFVLKIVYLWSGITHFVSTSAHHSASTYAQRYEAYLADILSNLSDWLNGLPGDQHISPANLQAAFDQHTMGCMVTMHALYNIGGLIATRHVHHALLSPMAVQRNIRLACYHAQQILRMASVLCTYGQHLPENQGLHGMLSPAIASAIFLAIDTITAGGCTSDLEATLAAVMDGRKILQVLGHIWSIARILSKQTEKRAVELQELLHNPGSPRSAHIRSEHGTWRLDASMEPIHEPHYDVMYGVNSQSFFDALQSRG